MDNEILELARKCGRAKAINEITIWIFNEIDNRNDPKFFESMQPLIIKLKQMNNEFFEVKNELVIS